MMEEGGSGHGVVRGDVSGGVVGGSGDGSAGDGDGRESAMG